MEINNAIKTLILKIGGINKQIEDNEVITFLIKNGISKETSVYVALFTPIILGRIICEPLNVNFVDKYCEHLQNETERTGLLSENYFYIEINKELNKLIQTNSISEEDILKIAFRSAEFKLLNDFLQDGNNVNDIQFSPLHINL
jgi:hypothetical protein